MMNRIAWKACLALFLIPFFTPFKAGKEDVDSVVEHGAKKTISMGQLNLYSEENGISPERLERIIGIIKRENCDIYTIQEAMCKSDQDLIKERLPEYSCIFSSQCAPPPYPTQLLCLSTMLGGMSVATCAYLYYSGTPLLSRFSMLAGGLALLSCCTASPFIKTLTYWQSQIARDVSKGEADLTGVGILVKKSIIAAGPDGTPLFSKVAADHFQPSGYDYSSPFGWKETAHGYVPRILTFSFDLILSTLFRPGYVIGKLKLASSHKILLIASAHFPIGYGNRKRSATVVAFRKALAEQMAQEHYDSVLIGADMNTSAMYSTDIDLMKRGEEEFSLLDAWQVTAGDGGATWDNANPIVIEQKKRLFGFLGSVQSQPNARIDHVFVKEGSFLSPIRATLFAQGKDVCSDHHGVRIIFESNEDV